MRDFRSKCIWRQRIKAFDIEGQKAESRAQTRAHMVDLNPAQESLTESEQYVRG
jgi:hypothetical protein